MTCSGPIADHDDYMALFCIDLDAAGEAVIDAALQLVTGQIYAALAASGQCDCAWADWALDYLKQLNILILLVTRECPCNRARVSDAEKDAWRVWIDDQLNLLRKSQYTICAGETGADYPAFGWAQPNWTEWITADLIAGVYD